MGHVRKEEETPCPSLAYALSAKRTPRPWWFMGQILSILIRQKVETVSNCFLTSAGMS